MPVQITLFGMKGEIIRIDAEEIVDYAIGDDGTTTVTMRDGSSHQVRDSAAGIAAQIRRMEGRAR